MKSKRFFKKILLSFILLVILYTSISALIFVRKNQELYYQETTSAREFFIESTTESMDNKLKIAFNLVHQLINNNDVKEYARQQQTDYFTITKIHQDLQEVGTIFSELNFNIAVTKPEDNLVITPFRTLEKQQFIEMLGIEKESLEEVNVSDQNSQTYKMNISYLDTENYVVFVINDEYARKNKITFYLTFNKDTFFPQISEGEFYGVIFRGELITQLTNSQDTIDKIVSREILSQLSEESLLSTTYSKSQVNNYTIFVDHSDALFDIYYLYGAYNDRFFIFTQDIWRIFSIVVSFLALGSFLAIFLADRTYKPIGNLLSVFKEYETDDRPFSDQNDEIKYIESSFLQVKKNNEALRKVVKNNAQFLKESFLKNLLYGVLPNSSIEEGITKYNLEFLKHPLRVILIEFKDKFTLEKELPSQTLYQLRSQILMNLKTDLSESYLFEIFELEFLQYGLIIKDDEIDSLLKTLRSSFLSIEEASSITLIGAVGSVVESYKHLKQSYAVSKRILENRFALSEKSIITDEDLIDIKETSFYYPIEKERDLIIYSIQNDENMALQILDEILHENQKRQLTANEQYQFSHAIANTINRIVQLTNGDLNKIFGDKGILSSFLMSEDAHILGEKIRNAFDVLFDRVKDSREKQDLEKSDDITRFIENNYHEDISLQDLAENLNLSTSYTSTLFKNVMGNTFKEYLNLYRITKAKELLKSKEMKISDIANEVGFTNVNTFIRVFKKYEGVSPGKYIQNINK